MVITPKDNIMDLDDKDPKFTAKLSPVIDKETKNHADDKERNADNMHTGL